MANARDISFASINLYNLQVPGLPTHTGSAMFDADTYEVRLRWVSRLLRELDADVIVFQEFWSAQALRDLLALEDSTMLMSCTSSRMIGTTLL